MEFKALLERAVTVRQQYAELERKRYGRSWTNKEVVLGFVGDVGDLAKLVTAMEGVRSIPDARQQLAHELADCLWSVLVLSHLYDVGLEQAFLQTMDQLEQHIRGSTQAPLLEETVIKREDIGGRAADQAFFCWEDSSNGLQGICPTMGQESDGEHGRSPE